MTTAETSLAAFATPVALTAVGAEKVLDVPITPIPMTTNSAMRIVRISVSLQRIEAPAESPPLVINDVAIATAPQRVRPNWASLRVRQSLSAQENFTSSIRDLELGGDDLIVAVDNWVGKAVLRARPIWPIASAKAPNPSLDR